MSSIVRRRVTAVAAAAVLLAGCTATSAAPTDDGEVEVGAAEGTGEGEGGEDIRVLQAGAPGEPARELSDEELEGLDLEVEHTEADVVFMQGMIPHHVQALRMTRLVPSRTSREDVPMFAERMDLSQEDEIALMERWLEARGEEVPSLLGGHDHGGGDGELMPGMLTEEELAALEAADGEAFDRLFLESMIRHHLGAMSMVEDLYEAEGGLEAEISQFANHVYSDQQIEVSRAEQMLAEMDAAG